MDTAKKFLFVNSSDFILIRLIAFAGQSITIGFSQYFFDFLPQVAWLSWGVALLLLLSVGLAYYLLNKGDKILTEKQIFLFLCFDILQISILISFNGGYTNPFIFIILAPIAIAASYLTLERIIVILSLALVCFALIFNFFIDLPEMVRPNISIQYSIGIMISLFVSSIFLVFYLYYFSLNYKSTQKAYELASKQLQDEKELLKVGGLAAAAVHELGTPLNTINLIIGDFDQDQQLQKKYGNDIDTLKVELDRCKAILKELSTNPESKEISNEISNMSLDAYVQSLSEQFRSNYKAIDIDYRSDDNSKNINIQITPELNIAMNNIIKNAISFAEKEILIISESEGSQYTIKIRDDGPGFDKKFIANFGKPFYSSRPEKGVNMGLGLFITKQMIENLNGEILVQNNNGAEVTLLWQI
ncbi:MAG: HAMP domain-containing histidine kinase [alpha proteobacterium HIMB59]|nr:MAG: HAMP domain-containing histidine kinase [alpha proteobacterium HIMB59]